MSAGDLRAVVLGSAGGPRWWGDTGGAKRSGIATAILVGDTAYLFDCGRGTGERLAEAGIPLERVRAVFLTHLHSDHVIGLPELLIWGIMALRRPPTAPLRIIGPGDRGALPPVSPFADAQPELAFPESPTPGTVEMVENIARAFGTDVVDRTFDSLRSGPTEVFAAEDIRLPSGIGYDPNTSPAPEMQPFEVYADELITVTATLVSHPPIAPAFAFRIDAAGGSVTISGDTAPSENLVRLAQNTDLLMHEAIDYAWVESFYSGEHPSTRAATIEHHRKSHTSPAEAARIAAAADAGTLLLHHLVPASTPRRTWLDGASAFPGPVVVPDDLDVIDVTAIREAADADAEVNA